MYFELKENKPHGYYKFIRHGKKRNVAVAAIARELACFVWGMMTDNIEMKAA